MKKQQNFTQPVALTFAKQLGRKKSLPNFKFKGLSINPILFVQSYRFSFKNTSKYKYLNQGFCKE